METPQYIHDAILDWLLGAWLFGGLIAAALIYVRNMEKWKN